MPTPVRPSGIGPDAIIPAEFQGLLGSNTLTPHGARIADPGPVGSGIPKDRLRAVTLADAGIGISIDGIA